jgi:hypothetical protein
MRPFLLAIAIALVLVPTASAATTPNFAFRHGEANYRTSVATAPGAYQGGARQPCPVSGNPACTYEAHEFEIAEGEENGSFAVTITWGSADDDWDLYVYKVRTDGTVDEDKPVASSASGGTTEETAEELASPDAPIEPGTYRIYVDNWAVATSMDWEGYVAFGPFVRANTIPIAALSAPTQAIAGQPVRLDASGSRDPDGTIVNYSWDLDGDGRFETDAGGSPVHEARFPGGRAQVGLRVRDDRGGMDFAAQTINVGSAPSNQQTPPTITEPFLPPPAARIALDLPRRQRIGSIALRGLVGTVECPTTCRISASLRISGATARRLGLGRRARTIARRSRSLGGNRAFPRVRLKPGRRTLRALRRNVPVSAVVRVNVRAAGFDPVRYVRTVTIVK